MIVLSGQWTGLEEAARRAYELGRDVANVEVLERAGVEVGRTLVDEIQRTGPRRPPAPDMVDDFVAAPSKLQREEGRAVVMVGPRNPRSSGSNGHGWLAGFMEFGTRKQRARPFIRPAYDGWRGGYPRAMAEAIRKQYDRVVRKYVARASK